MFDFDKMSVEQIHNIGREKDTFVRISKSICDYFCKSERFKTEEEYNEITIEAEKYHNPFALKRTAEYYRDGICVPQSDEHYISILEEFVNTISEYGNYIAVAWELLEEQWSGMTMGNLGVEDWIVLDELGQACKIIGLYYLGSTDLKKLQNAEYYLKTALGCHFDVKKEYDSIRSRTYIVTQAMSNPTTMIGVPEDVKRNIGLNPDDLFFAGEAVLKESFGDIWSKLADGTKAHLKTALFTYSQYLNCGENVLKSLDFSGVVSLLSRALEYELSRFFFIGYVQYLKQQFSSAEEFLGRNRIMLARWKCRQAVLAEDNGSIRFIDIDTDGNRYFSFKMLYALTGLKDRQSIEEVFIDRTCLDYCRLKTKLGSTISIKRWIVELAEAVEQLREKRNRASHGGTVLNTCDAVFAFEQIIWVRKVLILLKKPMLS